MSKKNISNYVFNAEDRFLFDTNIWFYLYGPQGHQGKTDKYAQIYSEAFKKIIHQGCEIYIDVLILSEFINRYVKNVAMRKYGVEQEKLKQFRNSANFKEIAQEVVFIVNKILNIAKRIPSGFESVELDMVLDNYSNKNLGFNDQMLEKICMVNNFKLVTHDTDFKQAKCTILTANNKLLT